MPDDYNTWGNMYGLTMKPNTVGVAGDGQHYARIVGFCQASAVRSRALRARSAARSRALCGAP